MSDVERGAGDDRDWAGTFGTRGRWGELWTGDSVLGDRCDREENLFSAFRDLALCSRSGCNLVCSVWERIVHEHSNFRCDARFCTSPPFPSFSQQGLTEIKEGGWGWGPSRWESTSETGSLEINEDFSDFGHCTGYRSLSRTLSPADSNTFWRPFLIANNNRVGWRSHLN